MDLYSSGASIQQANQYSEAAREANEAAKDFNNSLAAQLDEANTQLDEDAGENQALSLYKGGTSGAKLLAIAGGTKKAKEAASAAKGALKSATTIIPGSVTRAGEEGLEAITDAASFRRASAGVDLEAADEVAGGAGRFEIGATELGEALAKEGSSVPIGLAVPTLGRSAQEAADSSVEAASRSGIQTSSGIVGGETAIETSADAVRTGEFADLAGPGAKIAKGGTEAALDTALESAGKVGVGAAFKAGVAGVGGGLDIYKDVKSGFKFDNSLQAVGNIGNIFGSALEIGGALTAWTGFGLGVEAAGAALSVGSTALETAGDLQAADNKKASVEDDITSQQRQGVGAAATTTVAPRSN